MWRLREEQQHPTAAGLIGLRGSIDETRQAVRGALNELVELAKYRDELPGDASPVPLIEQAGCPRCRDVAFDMLRRASQQLNKKLRDLAEDVASTGEEPPNLR